MTKNQILHMIDNGITNTEAYGKKLDSDRTTIRSGFFMLGEVVRVSVDGVSLNRK